jgi:hypothetical protein
MQYTSCISNREHKTTLLSLIVMPVEFNSVTQFDGCLCVFQENSGLVVPWIIGFITFMALEAVAMVYSNVLRDHVNRVCVSLTSLSELRSSANKQVHSDLCPRHNNAIKGTVRTIWGFCGKWIWDLEIHQQKWDNSIQFCLQEIWTDWLTEWLTI